MPSKKSFYNKADKKVQRIAGTIGAVTVIIGAIAGLSSWVQSQFTNAISSQISDFQQETRENSTRHEQSVTRIELMVLMEHDPDNVAEIEKLAHHYFVDLGGDTYMTGLYSKWCSIHGGDPSIAIGDK